MQHSDSLQALDVALMVAVHVLEVGVVARDNFDHAGGGPGGDDGVGVPLGSLPGLGLQNFGSDVLTVSSVVISTNPWIFQ